VTPTEPTGRRPKAAAPFVIAHRGSSGRAPENTIEAFDRAVFEDGAEGLELDLRCTRDGYVVVLHDRTVDRTTDGRGPAHAFTLDELQSLDAGHRFRDEAGEHPFRGCGIHVPTLEDVLARYPDTWLSLDLKEGDPAAERRTVELVDAAGARGRVAVSAESARSARRLAALDPDLPRFFDRASAWRFFLRHRTRVWWGYHPRARSLQIPVSYRGQRLDTPLLLADAHRFGIAVRYWTVNDVPTMQRLIDRGADGIITDHPARLRDLLRSRGLR